MILRNFLYLDNSALDDYLATLQGAILDGPIEQTEIGKSGKGGKLGYKLVEGNISSESSLEKKRKLAVTDAAKFQQLYEILEELEMIKYLDLFDGQTWSEIRRGDLLEIQTITRLPELFGILQTVDEISPLIGFMKTIGQDPLADNDTKEKFEKLSGLSQVMDNQAIPILCQAVSTPGYEFCSTLSRQNLRVHEKEIAGEVTIFGKVQRIIRKGEQFEAFSLFPTLSKALPMNRAQKRKIQKDATKGKISEIIRGPAIALSTVAIYR